MAALLDRHGLRSLPIEERIKLFDELQENLEAEAPQALMDPKFAAELERRVDEHLANPDDAVPWEAVDLEIQEILKRCRAK